MLETFKQWFDGLFLEMLWNDLPASSRGIHFEGALKASSDIMILRTLKVLAVQAKQAYRP